MPLDDAAIDPEIIFVRRKLAIIARPEGLDGGYYEAQELAEAFLEAAREANADSSDADSPARLRLKEILERGIPYQMAMFGDVCTLPLADAASHHPRFLGARVVSSRFLASQVDRSWY